MRYPRRKEKNGFSETNDIPVVRSESCFSHLQPKMKNTDIFGLTSAWFRDGSNGAFSATYSVFYIIHEIKEALVPILTMRTLLCVWNYFAIVAESLVAVYDIVESRNSREPKAIKYATIGLTLFGSKVMGVGTTLSLLAHYHVLSGTLAVACAPLASLTPSFCSLIMAVIEVVHMYAAIRKMDARNLLKDRLVKISTIEDASPENTPKLEKSCNQYKAQALAIAKVEYFKGGMTKKELEDIVASVAGHDPQFVAKVVNKAPTAEQHTLVKFLKDKQIAKVRYYGVSAAFWAGLAIGVALVTIASFFCPALLIPGVAIVSAAVALKAGDMFEVDKRIRNIFSTSNEKAIKNDNPIYNYLANRKMEKNIITAYLSSNHLSVVPEKRKDDALDTDVRVKMRMAYELSKSTCEEKGISEADFYKEILCLGWWARRNLLNTAMKTYIKTKALKSHSFANSVSDKDQARVVSAYCRNHYSLFGKSRVPEVSESAPSQTLCTQAA